MENEKKAREMIKVFTFLMKRINSRFTFPTSYNDRRTVVACAIRLANSGELDDGRIVDYCVCQAYAISYFPKDYLSRWRVSHSFGNRAMDRYTALKREVRYYEDKWLHGNNLSRELLCELIRDRSLHPQARFIYPQYEDRTKKRLVGTMLGYYICGASTLLWTPFSPVCTGCPKAKPCEQRTRKTYPELYRIRTEEFNACGK